ncbi:MAG TPA: hypothetical protein VJX47_07815 [Candidatus Sulfotelmatobacter sp.]|nr:hypothetical protein [Candidatus Sulfotelmatobacter sp.]
MSRFALLVFVVALSTNAQRSDLTADPTRELVLLTLYSPRGPAMLELSGKKSWAGHLWLDHNKVGFIIPGQFLTLKLSEGEHAVAGEAFLARESSKNTVISLQRGGRYFVRLVVESKAVAGIGPTRWMAEQVTCKEAYGEAASLEPVKLKRIERPSLDHVARESYFPECRD